MISIRIQQLTKRFGTVTALDGLDLTIGPGELFFLLGPSGCGKTTLLRSLAGFYTPDAGRILFGDEDVTQVPPHKRNTGMMFQSYALWPHMTVAENVAFGLEERRVAKDEIKRRVHEALESVHMAAYAARSPNQLSGGQQQRLCIARALAIQPSIILMDEPTSALDPISTAKVEELIYELKSKYTIVIVTHNMQQAARVSDSTAFFYLGELIEFNATKELFTNPKVDRTQNYITGRFG